MNFLIGDGVILAWRSYNAIDGKIFPKSTFKSRAGFLSIGTIGILDQIILSCRGLSLDDVGCLAATLASTHERPGAFPQPSPAVTTEDL